MSAFKNQHYVPRFLLGKFSEDERSIRLFNINRNLFVVGASIGDQCSKLNFYSKTPDVEQALREIDTQSSNLVRQILDSEQVPPPRTDGHIMLVLFVVIQTFRTVSAASDLNEHIDKMTKHVLREKLKRSKDPDIKEGDLEGVAIGYEEPAAKALSFAASGHFLAYDLESRLLVNKTNQEFFISDHPVILYNQYLEHRTISSNTGLQSQGLQIYLPLSPKHMLIMFDRDVYQVGTKKQTSAVPLTNVADVNALNRASYINAIANIYFKSQDNISVIKDIYEKNKEHRERERTYFRVISREKTKSGHAETIAAGGNDLRLGLRPSVVLVRKSARQRLRALEQRRVQPMVLLRNPLVVEKYHQFGKRVEKGTYKPSEFPKFLIQEIKRELGEG